MIINKTVLQRILPELLILVLIIMLTSCGVKLEKGSGYNVTKNFTVISTSGKTAILGYGDILEYNGKLNDKYSFTIVKAKEKSAAEQKISNLSNKYNKLMNSNIDMNVSTSTGMTFRIDKKTASKYLKKNDNFTLYKTVQKNNTEEAKKLINKSKSINSDGFGQDALVAAAENDNPELVKLLVKKGVDLNPFNDCPLIPIVEHGNTEIVKYLVENGADVNHKYYKNSWQQDAKILYYAAGTGNMDIIKLLVDKGASTDNSIEIIRNAGYNKHINVIKYMFDRCDEPAKELALKYTVFGNNREAFDYMVKNGATYPETETVFIAIVFKDDDMLKKALTKSNINYVSKWYDLTPVSLAAAFGDVDKVKFFLSKGADLDIYSRNYKTALMIAAENGDLDMVKLLVNNKCDLYVKDHYKKTALHCAVEKGNTEIAGFLIDKGIDVNSNRNFYLTPLTIAAISNNLEMMKFLVNKGAKVNEESYYSRESPLYHAALSGNLENVKYLVENGAEPGGRYSNYPLIAACSKGHMDIVKYLVENGAMINVRDKRRNSPYDAAKEKHYDEIAEYLVAHGAQ